MNELVTLKVEIDSKLKEQVEDILSRLGITPSVAINMFFHQIVLTKGIPFPIALPKSPVDIDISQMKEEQPRKNSKKSKNLLDGRIRPAKETFNSLYDNDNK
ncbi:MAG: type II toxin-antitoxin system RelB/DinJ family antitoxin [Bacilli bacterium]|nr:type II toxin-antitoxin system RelB/DinJ family antitoxin [Bacilli bacterium]